MLTVQEIFNLVQAKYPHGYDNAFMIGLLNNIVREYLRTLFKPEAVTAYDLVGGNAFYAIGYSPEKIVAVVVGGKKYEKSHIQQTEQTNFYYIRDGNTIGIYPTPKDNAVRGLMIYHVREPKALTIDDLTVEPDFDRDWQMLLVYRLCKELAESDMNDGLINAYITQINSLEYEIKRSKVTPRHKIVNMYGGMV